MPHTKAEQFAIGKEIATGKINTKEAADKYGIGMSTAQLYARQYRAQQNIPSPRSSPNVLSSSDMEVYQSMSKDELINELIKAKVNEARAKKGYEVKGVGAGKEFISLNNKNSKL